MASFDDVASNVCRALGSEEVFPEREKETDFQVSWRDENHAAVLRNMLAVRPGGCCSPRHPTPFEPPSLEFSDTLCCGEQYRRILLAMSSN